MQEKKAAEACTRRKRAHARGFARVDRNVPRRRWIGVQREIVWAWAEGSCAMERRRFGGDSGACA
eukprot:5349054-Pleurochrysis_carterae.AAC.1